MELFDADWETASAAIEAAMAIEPPDLQPYLNSLLGITATTTPAAEQTQVFNEKMIGTGTAAAMTIGPMITWKDTVFGIGEDAEGSTKYVNALNTALKSIPTNITVTVKIVTKGSIPSGTSSSSSTPKPGQMPSGEQFASGANFIVPPGYPNDTYPMWVTCRRSGGTVRLNAQTSGGAGT